MRKTPRDQVLVGDCIELMNGLPEGSVDMVFADPPYGPLDLATLLKGVQAHRVVVENDREMAAPPGWQVTKSKRYGTTLVTMLEPDQGDEA